MCNDESQFGPRPSNAQMAGTFRLIRIHGCRLLLDFAPNRLGIYPPPGPYVLWAACAAKAKVESLTIMPPALQALEFVLSIYRQELPDILRTVRRISITPAWQIEESGPSMYIPDSRKALTTAQRKSYLARANMILRSSRQLEGLIIDSFLFMDEYSDLGASPVFLAESSMLLTANLTHLRSLSLTRIALRQGDLLHALVSCQPSLVAFKLWIVSLEQSSGNWVQVWRQLATMRQIHTFELGTIMRTVQFGQHTVDFVQDVASGGRLWKRKFLTTRAVQNELQRLIVFHQGLQNM